MYWVLPAWSEAHYRSRLPGLGREPAEVDVALADDAVGAGEAQALVREDVPHAEDHGKDVTACISVDLLLKQAWT